MKSLEERMRDAKGVSYAVRIRGKLTDENWTSTLYDYGPEIWQAIVDDRERGEVAIYITDRAIAKGLDKFKGGGHLVMETLPMAPDLVGRGRQREAFLAVALVTSTTKQQHD